MFSFIKKKHCEEMSFIKWHVIVVMNNLNDLLKKRKENEKIGKVDR